MLGPENHAAYLEQLGAERVTVLRARADRDSWQADAAEHPPDLDASVNAWERAATFGARHLAARVVALDADAVLAGAGVANLAAWLGVNLARDAGATVDLTAEIGLWGYEPTPADPFVLNHRNFPSATMLGDASLVLGTLVGGAQTTTIACLGGAQVDRFGNVNSTLVPGGPFLVGSGGGNDVASVCAEAVVVATLTPKRTPPECGYVTSPGHHVQALVTDLAIFEKLGPLDETPFSLTALAPGVTVEEVRAACGWEFEVAPSLATLPEPEPAEIAALRGWDPRNWFLRS